MNRDVIRQTNVQRCRQIDKMSTDRQMHRDVDGQTNKQKYSQTDDQRCRWTVI